MLCLLLLAILIIRERCVVALGSSTHLPYQTAMAYAYLSSLQIFWAATMTSDTWPNDSQIKFTDYFSLCLVLQKIYNTIQRLLYAL